jgi:hypothetical protein
VLFCAQGLEKIKDSGTIDVYVNVNQTKGVYEPVFILEIWQ